MAQIDDRAYTTQLRESGVAEADLRRLAIALQDPAIHVRRGD